VISENNILSDDGKFVSFQYKDSRTNRYTTKIVKGEDFLWLILQHVLPKGFRRIRDYGFLHGNAKRSLYLIQRVLGVIMPVFQQFKRPAFICNRCQSG